MEPSELLSKRLPQLDGVRTFAVLAVFGVHAFPTTIRGGGLGVDVFFVLSGFVITLLLTRELTRSSRIRIGRFYLLRLARLWPALLVTCTLVIAAAAVLGWSDLAGEVREAFAASLYFNNFIRAGVSTSVVAPATLFGHTWSLAVEEQFYLVWPIVFLLLMRFMRSEVAGLAALALAVVPAIVRATIWDDGRGLNAIYNLPFTRADDLLVGCGLALLCTSERRPQWLAGRVGAWLAGAFGVLIATTWIVLPTASWHSGTTAYLFWSVGELAIAIVAGVLIAALAMNEGVWLARLLAWRPISWFGRQMSYSFYLWHYPALLLIALVVPGFVGKVVALVLTVAVSFASSQFVERPIREWARTATTSHRQASIATADEA